ncbi:M48 family metalloprotease [Candidatus Daviesbacteria bacterium]|nr:M48 family metalloprotease [Candidatus Daviesbacteria bacterium]
MSIEAERSRLGASSLDQVYSMEVVAELQVANGEKTNGEQFSQEQFHNAGEYAEWKIRARLGIYPTDHPVSVYAQHSLQRIGGAPDQERPRITVYKGEPNAFIFPSGSVYLSDQLIKLAGTNEEILFVLMHERIHHVEAHSEKVFQRAEDQERTLSDLVFGGPGQQRVHEWEGDIKAFTEVDKLSINPMGGIELMEKFRQNPKLSGGLVHGKSTDRALNLRVMTYLKDLKSIEEPLHQIPQEVKDAIAQEQSSNGVSSPFDQLMKYVNEVSYFKSVETINKMDLNQALVALQTVIPMYHHNRSRAEGKDRYYHYAAFQKSITPVLSRKIWEELAKQSTLEGQPLSSQQVNFLFHSVLNLTLGVDATTEQELVFNPSVKVTDPQKGIASPWTKDKFSLDEQIYEDEDLNELLKVLNPETFEGLGLRFNASPASFVDGIAQAAMDKFIFEGDEFRVNEFLQFTESLATKVGQLYLDRGAVKANPDDVYQRIIDVADANLDKTDKAILLQRMQEVKPAQIELQKKAEEKTKAVEHETGDKLFNLFKRFSAEYRDAKEKSDGERDTFYLRSAFGGRERSDVKMDTDKYLPELRQILQEKQIQSPHELLVLLANFRKAIQADEQLWGDHLLCDNEWNSLVEQIVSETPQLNNFSSPLEKGLFDFKVVLLLAHDYASNNLLNPHERFGEYLKDEGFNLEWFRNFYNLASNESALVKETGVDSPTDTLFGPQKNEDWVDFFKHGKYVLLNKALSSGSRADFSKMLETLTNEFPFYHYGVDRLEDSNITTESADRKRALLSEVFRTYTFDFGNIQDLKDLYYLSTYLEDHSLAVRLQNVIWGELSKMLSFEEGFAFLEKELNGRRLLSLKAVSDFVEQNARTHEEIEMASQRLLSLLTQDSSLEGIGKLVMTEDLVQKFFLDNKYELLLACVGNGEDDGYLKRYLYKKWVACMGYDNVHLNDLMHRLYRLDAQSKYVLIRDLLTGDKGIFTDKDLTQRLEFVNFFLDNYVVASDASEEKYLKVIRDVMQEVARKASYDLLYFAISPIIQERMLIPPSNQVPWLDIIRTEEPPLGYEELETHEEFDKDEDLGEYWEKEMGPDYYDLDENGELVGNKNKQSSQTTHLSDFIRPKAVRKVDENDVNELFQFITGNSEKQQEFKVSDAMRREYEDTVDGLLRGSEVLPARQRMTVNEFMLEMAQKLGAPGVRFLQLVGQYVELPPNLEQAFNQVYDKMGGQSKITAHQTLLREWPEARERLAGLNERLGGGSLMSVFRTTISDGQDLAVKILNPNAGHHTDTTYKLLTEVFTALAERDSAFAPTGAMLDDIKEWIRGDIDFTEFLEMDREFKRKHNGYSTGGRYKIKVPTSHQPENKYFALEEFIDGINLTELDKLREQGHDLRQVTSLVAKNFIEQVKDGLVHSDIHPGNIRVTPRNEVVFLDRNYYQEFGFRDKLFLRNLVGALNNTPHATTLCLDYIQSQGAAISKEIRQRVIEQSGTLSQVSDPTDRLMRLAVILRKEGLKFPLKTTLLVKDFFYIDRLAKKVGYSGIAEALQAK